MSVHLFDYAAALAGGAARVGGKAWNMARLARWGFPVPAGLVLAIDDYLAMLDAPAVATRVAAAAAIDAARLNDSSAVAQLAELRAAILALAFAEQDMAQLGAALDDSGLGGAPVAVRSSATGEDGERHAFAGIHHSVLNVVGLPAVVRAIRACQASLWTPQAVAYRRRFGIADTDTRCAVLICRMVQQPGGSEPVAAGVAFTADPADGRRDRIVIEAVPGLGDKLVSGRATPATYRFTLGRRGIERTTLPASLLPASPLPQAPLPQAPLPAAPLPASPLPPELALRLARLAWRIHWAFGDGDQAQDIEWAFDGADFVILQVRPVTALPQRSFAGLAGQPVLWSNANLKEVLPGVLTPFTWSFMQRGIGHILFDAQRAAGVHIPDGLASLRRFDGRAYLDLSAMQWSFYEGFGARPAELNRELGGSQPEVEVPAGNPLAGRVGLGRIKRQLALARRLWRLPQRIPSLAAAVHARAGAFHRQDLASLPAAALAAAWRAWNGELCEFPSQLANAASGLWVPPARQLVAKHLPPERGEALISGLLAGAGGVVSAEHAYRLQDLARMRVQRAAGFEAAWQSFLAEFGHRGFVECDLASPRWAEEPAALEALLDALAGAPHDRETAQARRRAAEGELRRLPPLPRLVLRWLIKKAADAYAAREASKSALVAMMSVFRRLALEVGRRLVAAGQLDDVQDVFYLSEADLQAWLDGAWDGRGARERAVDQRRLRDRWLAMPEPADVLVEPPGQAARPCPADEHAAEDGWRGIAAAPGRVRGSARVLHHPGEGARLQRGDILVARATDPGWTPMFLMAAGIVAETGGYLSHSAIVAREFGIPAVVNLPGFLAAVTDGDELAVNGDRGIVSTSN